MGTIDFSSVVHLKWRQTSKEKMETLSVNGPLWYRALGITLNLWNTYAYVFSHLQMVTSLETKGGAIQNVSIWDVTKFYANDVIVVDNKGTATVFCNEQILVRKAVSEHCVHCLQIQQDPRKYLQVYCDKKNFR